MNPIIELNDAFRNIVFTEDGHTYRDRVSGKSLLSVTGLVGSLKGPYEEAFWATYKAFEQSGYAVKYQGSTDYFLIDGKRFNVTFDSPLDYNLRVTPDMVKREWRLNGLIGRERGTLLHNYLENKWLRKEIKLVIPEFVTGLSTKDAIEFVRSIDTLKVLANEFYDRLSQTHISIAQEFVVGDAELDLAGTFDLLLLNKESGELELWDYKTDKKFETSSRYKFKHFDLDSCELNKYSLQLGMYKHMIEKNTQLKISGCYVSHFNFKTRENTIHKLNDYQTLLEDFFNDNKPTHQLHSWVN